MNAAHADVQHRIDAVPSPQPQAEMVDQLLGSLDRLWTLPPRRAATMLQRMGVYAWCAGGEVVQVEFREL